MSKFPQSPLAGHAAPPLSVGQVLRLHVHDVGFGGEGIARTDDFVVFVTGALPEEEVEARITEVKKQFARAELIQILKTSKDRVKPECKYFGECGGCQYQHLRYPRQLELKHKQVADLLQRIGGFDPRLVNPVIPCPNIYGYRNRIMVRSYWNKDTQRLDIGFLQEQSRKVVDVDRCSIADPRLNEDLFELRRNPPHKGGIKVVLRVMPEGWELPRDSFFQNNFVLLPELVKTVRELLKESGTRHLLDAYCGVGFFSMELADLVDSYVGVELDALAIRAARDNAIRFKRANGRFIDGHAEALLPKIVASMEAGRTTVIVDPPRTGCGEEIIHALRKTRPKQVIYVSCHPATLARDLKRLCEGNLYRLRSVTPLDMFPQTQHVESVADIRRVEESD